MISFGAVAFLVPIVLLGLLVLPALWWLLRATPPAPSRLKFPGVGLLLGLVDTEKMPDRTPIWLLLLRMLAIAAVILAFAEPVLNVDTNKAGEGPLLVLMDGGWASAPDWDVRVEAAQNALKDAAGAGRPTVFISIASGLPVGENMSFKSASDWLENVRALAPQPWGPDRIKLVGWLEKRANNFDTYWITDGLADGSDLLKTLTVRGAVQVVGTTHSPLALRPLAVENGRLMATVMGVPLDVERGVSATAIGLAPNGAEVTLAIEKGVIGAQENTALLEFDLPLELRNRVTRIVLEGVKSAGGVALADDGLRRRKVALVGDVGQEGSPLVQPMHYLRQALRPSVVLIEADLGEVFLTNPDVIILSDVGELSIGSTKNLLEWVESGGLLVRFAGPNLAAVGAEMFDDPLLPVRLRSGGRNFGGAMSWGTPRHVQDFPENSPFFGLQVPRDVTVTAQVVAQPSPSLAARTLAALEDGTPLVTQDVRGEGRVVLFHVTANAEWSSLPLSGLFVEMLERLSISTGGASEAFEADERMWLPDFLLDGFGQLSKAEAPVPVVGTRLSKAVGPDAPPGIYRSNDLGAAVNVLANDAELSALNAPIEMLGQRQEKAFKPWLLLAGLALLAFDILATLWVTGKLQNRGGIRAAGVFLLLGILPAPDAQAQDALALLAANDTVLAYVITGDAGVDRASGAGLLGLSRALAGRTSIDPGDPIGVNLEMDELAFFPLIYWPITEAQSVLSDAAIGRLNQYMRRGGMIFFDTRDGDLGGVTRNAQVLKRITGRLDIPPLGVVPSDHVLTRAFYLLSDFPGRWSGASLWVEANAGTVNDGVTPVVIGANDWAAAWAIKNNGAPMFPVGRGLAGSRQREMSVRFGVNLVMYVMTGNYKSDQVHVPALLERLGE